MSVDPLTGDTTLAAVGAESTAQVSGSFYELFPGYASSTDRKADARAVYGKTWIELRKAFVDAFDLIFASRQTKAVLREVIMENTWRKFPVRTGHLFDYIFRTMEFHNTHSYNTRHELWMQFRWPYDRPNPIKGNVSHTFSTGYSKLPIPPPIYAPPNAHMIGFTKPTVLRKQYKQVFGFTLKGGDSALWGLNDPHAVNDPASEVLHAGIREMRSMFRNVFQGMRVYYKMKVTGMPGTAVVSNAGATTQITGNPMVGP